MDLEFRTDIKNNFCCQNYFSIKTVGNYYFHCCKYRKIIMSNEPAEDMFINEKFCVTFPAVLYLVFHL